MTDSIKKHQGKENKDKGYIQAIILSLIIVNIPFVLFALLYKTPSILENKIWTLGIVSLLLTGITLFVNYYLISLRDVTNLFLNPQQLASEITKPTKISQIAMQGHKKKKKKEMVFNENKYREILAAKIASMLSIKNKKNWYETSIRMTIIFSIIVIAIHFLNIEKHLLSILIVAELLFFIVPILIDYVKIKSLKLDN